MVEVQIGCTRRGYRWLTRLVVLATFVLLCISFSPASRIAMMKFSSILPIAGAAAVLGQSATSSSSSYVMPQPSGTVEPNLYNGTFRPQVHFSPPTGFMNDPNGLFIDSEGTWHQYYQYNPYNTVAGNQTWGHATSRDLHHWVVQPIALAPTNGSDYVFSGSAVVDYNNTSGFFPNQTNGVVAIFTTAGPVQQLQDIAYSYDNGYTFTRYAGNPVLQIGSMNFRDPKVIWHSETERWVMVLVFAQEFTIGIYTSPNLKEWTFASNFSHHGLLGYQYECPNMVQMPMQGGDPMWLMYVSINPGAPLGGSIGQYFPGHFNGTHFTAVDAVARIADFGKDNYASQFWYGIPGDQPQISIGWASNWEYTNRIPTGPAEGWASAFSVPRINYLKNLTRVGYNMVSQPYNLAAIMPDEPFLSYDSFGNQTVNATFGRNGGSGAILLDLNVTQLNVSAAGPVSSINFTVSSSVSGESLKGGQFFAGDYIFWLDRSQTFAFNDPFFVDKFSVANLFEDSYHLQVIVDRSVLEAFILDGQRSGTLTFFPEAKMDTVSIAAHDINPGAIIDVKVYELESIWSAYTNSSGFYHGNSSTMRRGLDMAVLPL